MLLHDFLDYRARIQPESEFAVQGERRLTYRQAQDEVHRLANAFLSAGLGKGDRVAVLAKNSVEYALLYFAASKAGVVPVPLNYRLTPAEWSFIVHDSGARMLIAGPAYVAAIDAIRADLAGVEGFVSIGAGEAPGWMDYGAWTAAQPATAPHKRILETDDLYQMYTSGTTGHPKGAVLSHAAVTAHDVQLGVEFRGEPGDRWLVVAPLYHTAGASVVFISTYWGGRLLIQEDFVPAEVVRAFSEEHIRNTILVPAMIQACLTMVPDVAERRYDGLGTILYGASPIAEATLRRAIEVFGCGFVQVYGMTEVTGAVTVLLPSDHALALATRPQLLLSAGRPLLGVEIRIVDENDEPLPPGEIGEIVMRGPLLMNGYWNLPQATAEALHGGWMHSGDAGVMDRDGYIYVQDRIKDMIISGAENIYPREVEDVLFQHPAVADAAVIGVPDERWGETVKAVVQLRASAAATDEEIIEFCRGRLAGFKRPRSVDFVEALPRNPSGKVLKRQLREPYWAGQQRAVAGA